MMTRTPFVFKLDNTYRVDVLLEAAQIEPGEAAGGRGGGPTQRMEAR